MTRHLFQLLCFSKYALMLTFNTVLTAICSLTKCFPELDLNLRLEEGFLLTTDLCLATKQNLTVSLDIASNNFWVFGANKVGQALLNDIPSGVLQVKNDRLVVFNQNGSSNRLMYQKPIYEDNFNVSIQYARSIINLNTDAIGIPQIGVAMKNVTSYMSYLIGGSGVFGIGPESYANGIAYSRNPGNILLLYTPTYGKLDGRVATGQRATDDRCSKQFLNYPMVNVEDLHPNHLHSGENYFAFNSTLTNTKMILSTMTSYVAVDHSTFQTIERVLLPVWDNRNLSDGERKPYRRHKIVPCNLVKDAPKITFGEKGRELTLEGTDYVKRTVTGYCILKIRQMFHNEDHWVLGYPFLQKYCLKIDFFKRILSFANSNQVAGEATDE